jgi:hypothetical protein
MVKAGAGAQNFTIGAVHDFMCIAALREGGYFDLRFENDEALDEFIFFKSSIWTCMDALGERNGGGWSLERTCLRFIDRDQNALKWSCRSIDFQRTANMVLTVCVSQGDNPILSSYHAHNFGSAARFCHTLAQPPPSVRQEESE